MILGGIKQSLPWVIREYSSEELSKNLSEMEGAKQASAEGAFHGKDKRSSNIPESGAAFTSWDGSKGQVRAPGPLYKSGNALWVWSRRGGMD